MQTDTDEVAIRVCNLAVYFGKTAVLRNLSLDVKRGEILGLVGASVSGKSVLLRTIVGLIPKQTGQIQIDGIDVDHATVAVLEAIRRHWGVLFQQGALFSSLTVRQNIQLPLRENLDLSPELLDELATVKLEMVGLTAADAEKMPSELSGGMTKRVALARALALDPKILFLDEPTSGLDPILGGDFDSLIKTLQKTLGFTVLMATHDLDTLHTVCDRVAVLADGSIVVEGSMPEILMSEHPWVKAYFRGKRSRTHALATN